MLSPSASSSAVTIPTPGKSILKRPPPPQQSFFSLARLSKLLPTQNQPTSTANDESNTLKRAHFILPEMTTVYPILAANPPSTPSLKEEKRSIEERELERRKRVVRGNNTSSDSHFDDDWWSMEKVEGFFRECCLGREEVPDPAISAAFKRGGGAYPRTVDFSGIQLNLGVASVLSDVFTIEWGLRKLVFKECDLDEIILKPILHSLLIPGTLTFLSVSSNRRLKAPALRLIGAYVTKARSLQFLDLSQNALDKKCIEYIAAALPEAPIPGLVSLRLDDCALKPQALDALAHSVRKSSLRNISLRHNRISATGAVAIALMIKDYPDRFPSTTENGSGPPSPATSTSSLSTFNSPPPTPISQTRTLPSLTIPNGTPPAPPKAGPILPPPRHPSAAPQTTYTPYIPRARRGPSMPTPGNTNPLSASGKPIPIITSSAQGGVTARHPVPPPPSHPTHANGRGLDSTLKHGPSVALLEQVRALDNLPRLGALQTLDLKGNDIRNGITYVAQVLKRNRTLKVLNLSENKLDVQGLTAVAEALVRKKYNSCLETLDLSKNPCCGPGLEGIQSLRTAFTLNNALKRLFLSSTSMASQGAIALAEFLPESASLLHLDLTMNNLDLAGVMALSSGLKANHVMRCLDLNIPPGDEEMARMCRYILESCVRNTEEADKASHGGASGRGEAKGVWGMIEQSELAKSIREDDRKKVDDLNDTSSLLSSRDPTDIPSPSAEQTDSDLMLQARARKTELEDLLSRTPSSSSSSIPMSPIEGPDLELLQSTREMMRSIVSMIERTSDPVQLDSLLSLNDELMTLLGRLEPKPVGLKLQGLGIHPTNGDAAGKGREPLTSESSSTQGLEVPSDDDGPVTPRLDKGKGRAEPEPEPVESVLSPTFLITESDEEEAGTPPMTTDPEDLVSPTDLSRRLVEEEGEVFRKGAVLLTTEEMESEYDGEELRKELLEAMVERPPPRMVDEFGAEIPPPLEQPVPSGQEPKKPPPRPYVRRSRSSSSTLSVDSQSSQDSQNTLAPMERSHSLPGSGTASPVSPSAAVRSPLLARRSSSSSISSSIQEAPEPTS